MSKKLVAGSVCVFCAKFIGDKQAQPGFYASARDLLFEPKRRTANAKDYQETDTKEASLRLTPDFGFSGRELFLARPG